MDNSIQINDAPDWRDTLLQRYASPAYREDHQILNQDQTWTLMKVICSLAHVETTRGDAIRETSWRGFSMEPDDFVTKLTDAGVNTLPNIGVVAQNPKFIANLHALYLEKTTNSMALLRKVDAVINDPQNDEGKKLKAIALFMEKEDPVLALEALCTKVIQLCTYMATREGLAIDISNSMEQYESRRAEVMEVAHGTVDGKYPPPR